MPVNGKAENGERNDVKFSDRTPPPEYGNGKHLPVPAGNGVKAAEVKKLFSQENDSDEEEGELEPEERCGFFCFKPDFMQKFRNMKVFLVVYIVAGMTGGMYFAYWNMTLSSIEKRFQIPSQTTGMLTAVNDISHILVVLIVAHFCGKSHRPRWIFVGGFLVGIAVMMFGAAELFAAKWDTGGLRSVDGIFTRSGKPRQVDKEVCLNELMANETADKCDAESVAARDDIMLPISVLVLAQVLLGIGTTAPVVLAMPFIDDNVKTKNSPIYFALGLAGRFTGPTIGVLIGSLCLSTYVDLSKPNIAQTDPRWMGAWWLGFAAIGAAISLTSFLYLCFPKSLSRKTAKKRYKRTASTLSQKSRTSAVQSGLAHISKLPRDIKRLLTNKIFTCRLINDCIDMLVVSGYLNFASKYIEFHFRMSPAEAGRANGLSNMLAMGTGVAVGGLLIRKFKLQPKHVAMMVIVCSFLTGICYFFLMMVRCEPRILHSNWKDNGMLNVDTSCSNDCNCAKQSFSPVCDQSTGINYYSPCHAGCNRSFTDNMTNTKYYTNCLCLVNTTLGHDPDLVKPPPTVISYLIDSTKTFLLGSNGSNSGGIVKRGFCEGGCDGFWTYIAISGVFRFILMLPVSGNQMLTFRIVEPDLKALSKGIETMAASLFAFIPGPIIMGTLIDSTCKLWNTVSCGKTGACLVYDLDALRTKMHLYVGFVKTIAVLMDIYVYFKVRKMNFEREPVAVVEEADLEETLPTGSVRDLTAHN